jgi:large subunit ribosomal protein L25
MLKLEARRRVGTGKGAGRRIRDKGMIPAVLYGNHGEAVSLALDPKAVRTLLKSPKGENTTFELNVDGGETVPCTIVRTYQKDPVRRTLLHCDLIRLDPNKNRNFQIPVLLTGTSLAEKEGGRLLFITRTFGVECVPADVPVSIEVDVFDLDIGDRLRLSDVPLPSGLILVDAPNTPVVTATTALAEIVEEEELEEGEEGEEGAEGSDASTEGAASAAKPDSDASAD